MSRIVVIDDEPVLRLTFRLILEQDGHEVWDAENGKVGVDICRHERPDLVVTDIMMPEQEGIETLTILHDEFPDLPIIAMSGAGVGMSVKARKALNGYTYVAKPVEKPVLLELVRNVLDKNEDHNRGDETTLGEDSGSDL